MPRKKEELEPLPKDVFLPAAWAATREDGRMTLSSVNWMATVITPPDGIQRVLHPLRVKQPSPRQQGRILPHIYAQEMHDHERRKTACGLTKLQADVIRLFGPNTGQGNTNSAALYRELRNTIQDTDVALGREFDALYNQFTRKREAQHRQVARHLSKLIGERELYIVCRDTDAIHGSDDDVPLFAAPLGRIAHLTQRVDTGYQPVVYGVNCEVGLLPESFRSLAGVHAPEPYKTTSSA